MPRNERFIVSEMHTRWRSCCGFRPYPQFVCKFAIRNRRSRGVVVNHFHLLHVLNEKSDIWFHGLRVISSIQNLLPGGTDAIESQLST